MNLFCCENISKSYQGTSIIQDINIKVYPGEIVGLLGLSGVGKTTLMNILSGTSTPDSGKVLLQGNDITGCSGKVSYMLQKDLLFPFKTIADNVSLPLRIKGMPKKEAYRKVKGHFGQFGLEGTEDKYPHQLSGGMRQRAAFLRTYFMENTVLLLDEPFSALDAFTKNEMHQWYLEMAARLGLSTLFITHDVDEAISLSDRVYIMAGIPGQIAGEIKIEGPKPRTNDFVLSGFFLQYKKEVLGYLQEYSQ